MKRRARILPLVFTVLASVLAGADTLYLEGGDRLTGTLADITNGSLSFRTKLAGKLYLPLDRVRGVDTTGLITLTLTDGKTLAGRLAYEKGESYLYTSDDTVHGPIQLAEITKISTLPPSALPEQEPSPPPDESPLTVHLDTGYRWRSGTENFSGPRLRLRLLGATKSGTLETTINLEHMGEDGGDGALNRFFDAQARATIDRGATWNPEVTLQLERDRNKGLELRSEILAGLGREVLRDDKQRLHGAAGLGVAFERYDVRPLRRDQGATAPPIGPEEAFSRQEINLDLQLRYERNFLGTGVIRERLTLRPSLSNFGDLRTRLESSVSVPIYLGIKLKVDLLVDYEDDPQYADIDEWSTAFGASMHVDF